MRWGAAQHQVQERVLGPVLPPQKLQGGLVQLLRATRGARGQRVYERNAQ